ncbi:nicotinate (nicotinamide) nucleotide adenylyltransferase [Rasiella sp. SM2506]|uniref:nicotinate (nicotinamide) nucleotide adenylyltransferase n=1 Tax=Rasiella sp. SM2506 TaxID=3423914 RepID=UPI003D7BE793
MSLKKNKKIGLYFGTFNPIHVGHLTIANHMVEFGGLDEVWMVVTPHNPHKKKSTLLDNHHRIAMVDIALEQYPKIKSSKIEFDLPQPNYTVNTLVVLQEKYPEQQFCLIMGEDNLKSLHKWKNYEVILERYPIYVYPRISGEVKVSASVLESNSITKVAAPIMELSSTFIRKAIKNGKNIRPMLPQNVWEYLDEMNFYK